MKNPKQEWDGYAKQSNWRDYILPRSDKKQDLKEGLLQALEISKLIGEADTVIDYGCGEGRVAAYLKNNPTHYKEAKNYNRVIGLDVCKDFIDKGKQNCKNVEFYTIDEFKEKEIADAVFCLMVIQHNDAENRLKIINHIKDLLKVGGKTYVQFPRNDMEYYKETSFEHTFSKSEVEEYAMKFGLDWKIIPWNLVGYSDGYSCEGVLDESFYREWLLIATK